MYHVRVDTELTSNIVQYLVSIATQALYCQEEAKSGKHCHLFLVTEVKMPKLRYQIRKEGFTGNKSYSISTVRDRIKTLAYIMKEGNFHIKNISTEDLELARNYVDKVQREIKEKKSSSKDVIKEIEEVYKERLETMGSEVDPVSWQVLGNIIDWMLDRGCQVRRFQVQSIYDTLGCKHSQYFRMRFAENCMLRKF